VLVPTTVLAHQHWTTFSDRFAAFPAKVELLSRFRSPKEQKAVVEGLAKGTVDVVIGTHRVLSRDVSFKNLGLLVVDEEHRFGVAHKERMKQLRTSVDVLSMTATPIPRTLYMALSGVRDMSVIETAPLERLPVETMVRRFSKAVIREALERELERGGQVFFVHNRIQSLVSMTRLLQELVPDARMVMGHGQMKERELEATMVKFVTGQADVLVSTAIVESGLDIPASNTIIINRADRFGLAQLYQLRGRVGRERQQAYAFLLVPPDAQLDETAVRDFGISFPPWDVPRDQFIDGSTAWCRARAGELDPSRMGLSGLGLSGMWFAAGEVMLDVAALNKEEMLPWEKWSVGRELGPGATVPASWLTELDTVAGALAGTPDAALARRVYAEHDWLRVTPTVLSFANGAPVELSLAEDPAPHASAP